MTPKEGVFDEWDPANISPLVAWLCTEDCPATAQVYWTGGNQVARYLEWQTEARKGYRFIPRRYRIPIKTASDMYSWTASRIARDPFVVFRRQVKPAKGRVILSALWNVIRA